MMNRRYHITLLFNANKAYDRQVIEGIGEYLQASQCHWDIFIEEDFTTKLNTLKTLHSDGIIADFDDIEIQRSFSQLNIPVIGVGGSYLQENNYPAAHYIATNNFALIESAFNHLKDKGIKRFAFYGLPQVSGKRWAIEREHAFRQLIEKEQYQGVVYQGMETTPENWSYAQNRLKDWIQTLPPNTGIIAVTDARARHILSVCEHLDIPIPDKICVIGIDNEEIARFLSRTALSSVVQGTQKMGYQAAKLLHQLLEGYSPKKYHRQLIPPLKVIARQSTDFRALKDPLVIQAMHYIRHNACKGIKVEQVIDAVGISRSNLENRFKKEFGQTIHTIIHNEKLDKVKNILTHTSIPISEIVSICGYSSLHYFYSMFKRNYNMTPKEYRDRYKNT
ncbi:DNA-binding transcriptional regulator [Photorhabdus temperata]|uniref:Transcriptional regulator, AraC family n=1 Tax=Photorhabdus temperata subsp. temperata Meg1 TaxID=1393735 RepID=A0A081RVB2_PHOTE|nr:DNA-binding transcriptional regulator [Photorhabdus temperata]KER02615.1 transcriptional regulator, AraC family [Photorhabdus temperata subsp. temperata Meg1]MCT8348009.1 DNA-binding transcriptional regulator [Photorhabdus temperata]